MKKRTMEIIQSCPFFEGINLSGLHPVYKVFRRKEEITDILDNVPCVGILGSGEADVYTVSDELSQPNVSTQHAGCIFGICNLYLPEAMPTRLVCKVQSEIVFIPKEEFKELMQNNQVMTQRYLTLCNQKIIYLAQKIELMGIASCKGKFSCFLLRNADTDGRVLLDTSKEQFAKYLNVSRASLFRTIADFTNKNLIISTENGFQIIDKDGLTAVRQGE